jgi:hypothetical protein
MSLQKVHRHLPLTILGVGALVVGLIATLTGTAYAATAEGGDGGGLLSAGLAGVPSVSDTSLVDGLHGGPEGSGG